MWGWVARERGKQGGQRYRNSEVEVEVERGQGLRAQWKEEVGEAHL